MKIRKSIKDIVIGVSIILIIISFLNIISIITQTNTINSNNEIYKYTNKFKYDYTVNLLKNDFIPDKNLGMSEEAYITDLIDNIKMNFNYTYEGSSETKIDYDYQIVGILSATYSQDGIQRKVWEKEDVLKKIKENSKTGNSLNINENLTLDLKKYNKLVREFENKMGMTIAANYNVMLKINTYTNVEKTEVENTYTPLITINLAEKVTTISGDNELENTEYISKASSQKEKINIVALVIYIIILAGSIILLRYILRSKTANIVRNEYRKELNKILRLCEDKIVQVSQNPNTGRDNVIDVADFGEILKVSEELFKPILYWYSEETEEAEFSVISNSIIYRYILKK